MTSQTDAPKFFYGWVIVGVGMVVTCIALGAMTSLGIFLQRMSEAMGSAIGVGAVAIALTFRSGGPLSAPVPSPSAAPLS